MNNAGTNRYTTFTKKVPCWAFYDVMHLSNLSNGYIKSDTVIIEVQIFSVALKQLKEIPTKSMKSATDIHSNEKNLDFDAEIRYEKLKKNLLLDCLMCNFA